jgi:hypothetical protein
MKTVAYNFDSNDIKSDLTQYLIKLVNSKCKEFNSPKLFLNKRVAEIETIGLHPTKFNKTTVSAWSDFSHKDLIKVRNQIEKNEFYTKRYVDNLVIKIKPKK